MRIQSISVAQHKPVFGTRRLENLTDAKLQSINASLYDLYSVEDNIKNMIQEQNKLLADALRAQTAHIIYNTPQTQKAFRFRLDNLENSNSTTSI